MNKRGNKSKETYGSGVKRSEYDDGILRNNQRTGNRLKIDMTYYDRAQKVIMKDLGKESLLLQNKLENEKRTLSMGLYGSKIGMTSTKGNQKYNPTSPIVPTSSSPFKPTYLRTASKTETKFPWDRDLVEKDSGADKETEFQNNPSPLLTSRSSIRFKTPSSSAYPTSRVQTDEFLASILNEAMNDELLYTQRPEMDTNSASDSLKQPNSSRRKSRSSRSKSVMTTSDSIVNSLMNAQEADEVIY